MFYDLKVTYGNLEFYYHEDFYKTTYSPNVMKISMRLRTVPTYALDWATIVAHIPWISQCSHFLVSCFLYAMIADMNFMLIISVNCTRGKGNALII